MADRFHPPVKSADVLESQWRRIDGGADRPGQSENRNQQDGRKPIRRTHDQHFASARNLAIRLSRDREFNRDLTNFIDRLGPRYFPICRSIAHACFAKLQHRRGKAETAQIQGCHRIGAVALRMCQLNREFKMRFKKASMAVMLAVSMASTPVLAQSASSLSVAASAPARASAEATDANDINGGWFIPLLAVLAVIGGIIAIASGGDDGPTSP